MRVEDTLSTKWRALASLGNTEPGFWLEMRAFLVTERRGNREGSRT